MNTADIYSHGLIDHKRGLDLNLLINTIAYFVMLVSMFYNLLFIDANNVYYLILNLVLFGAAFSLHFINNQKVNTSTFILILLLVVSLLGSYGFNGFQHGNLAIFIVFFGYLYLFCILPKYKLNMLIDRTIILYCLYFSLVPVLLYLVFNQQTMLAYDGTFAGFSGSRSGYGYIAGATVLVLIIRNTRMKYIVIPFVAYGLILSQSRSGLIATLIASLYVLINRQKKLKKLFMYLIAFILIAIAYQMFTQYATRNTEKSDQARIYILTQFIEFIKARPIWGYGDAYKIELYSDSERGLLPAPVHNTILQIWANYGVIVLVSFFVLYFHIMTRFDTYGRAFFLYLLILGMFQPEFGVGINPLFCIITIFAICYNQYGLVNMPQDIKRRRHLHRAVKRVIA